MLILWFAPLACLAKFKPVIDMPVEFKKRSTCPECGHKF